MRSKDVPATMGMLHMVRDELKSDIRSLEHKMDGLRSELKGEMSGLKFELKSEMEKISAKVHHMNLLAEEQLAQNRIVMDGLTGLFGRQERVETRIDDLEKTFSELKR